MSGRKSTEVNGLLARGRLARDAGNANYLNKFRMAEKCFKENQSQIDRISRMLSQEQFEIDENLRQEFPEESRLMENILRHISNANKGVNFQAVLFRFSTRSSAIDAELKQADRESDSIRERIKNKDWYCDREYQDADVLLNKYNRITQEKNQLAAAVDQAAQDSNRELVMYRNLERQMCQVKDSYQKLRERWKKVEELKSQAAKAKSYIGSMFEEIDSALAQKYLRDAYAEISDKVHEFSEMPDQQAVNQVTLMSEKISMFVSQMQQRHAEFLEKKEEALSAFEGNGQLLSIEKNFYYDPIDYFKNKNDAEKISLLDYLREYSDKTEMINSIEEGMKTIEELLEDENYEQAFQQAVTNTKMIEQAAAYAAIKQEQMMKNFYVAKDIKKVMMAMGYETGAMKREGHIKNGWRITAKSPGGECIDFSQVFINDAGRVNIDIDHKETGSCVSRWKEICQALDDAGIYIEKMNTAKGTNVINRREVESTQNHSVQCQQPDRAFLAD